jgi:hypothetical protein
MQRGSLFFDMVLVGVKSIDTAFAVQAQSGYLFSGLALLAVAPQKSFQH